MDNVYCVAGFNNRYDSFRFKQILDNNGIFSTVIDTPSEINSECSLSIRFSSYDLNAVRFIESKIKSASFVGFYKVEEGVSRRKVTRIY